MTFFKELRRRSRASFRTSESSEGYSNTVDTHKSSSTLSSSFDSGTPPSSHPTNASYTTLPNSRPNVDPAAPPVPPRPSQMSSSNRNSMITTSPTASTIKVPPPTSIYAPRITSIIDNSVVHQKVLLIHGEIADPQAKPMDGNVTVHHDKDGQTFPPTNWPVSDSYFKALVYLSPGWNRLRFDFTSPKLSSGSNSPSHSFHSSYMMLNYLPLNNSPPLQLAIIVGKDSPCTFDATPGRIKQEGNDLSLAIRKFRMAAHLWQSFTAEQMYRNKLGRRCFRFEEEWQVGTLSIRDWESSTMKNEARVHVIRSNHTVEELRNLDLIQQRDPEHRKKNLFDVATDAIKEHFNIRGARQKQYVAALILDSHWDKEANDITAHAALGGGGDDLGLAIFGSHALQSYPSCIEEVVPAFMDCTKTDLNYVANDANESGSSWEAANIGIGAHLHEVGHLLGSPHQERGVMLRDYVHLNRTFSIRESYSTRTKSQGLRVCRVEDECGWHRLDTLRFRHHPCFRLPSDEPLAQDDSIQFFSVGNGKLVCMAPTGISFIEIFTEGDELCRHWLEYISPDPRNGSIPKQLNVTEAEIRARLPEDKKRARVKLHIWAGSNRNIAIDDIAEVMSRSYVVNLPPLRQAPKKDEGMTMNAYNNMMGLSKNFENRQGFKSLKLGNSSMQGSQPQEVILESASLQSKLLTSVRVYSGLAVDGLEFCYEDGMTQLFGKRGGKPGGDEFFLDTRRGETILGFTVRSGAWIDGIEILTSSGRRSGMYGNVNGGYPNTLMTPRGYSLAGIAGSCAAWVDGFQIIITR